MNLFDLDGTLIDSNGVWEWIDLEFLGRHGLAPTREYSDTVGHSIFPIAAQFTRDYYHLDLSAEDIMAEWLDLAREEYAQKVPFKPGAEQYLRQCRADGATLALVTACVPELCRAALERHKLGDFFSAVIFVQEMGLEKRNPEVFLRAAKQLNVSPADCTMYEDSPNACAAAKKAGMRVVGVFDRFYAHCEADMRSTCDLYIHSFTELLR